MHTKDEKLYLKYKEAYYNSIPLVSDDVFDALEEKIRRENPNSSVLNIVGSTSSFPYLIKHDKEMLSLNKTYSIDELFKWMGTNEICYSYKLDGMAVSLIYNSTQGLVLAKTRGDGVYGKNITENFKYIHIPNIKSDIEVRGEVIITKNNFTKLIDECNTRNLDIPTSMRNAVAGLLNPNKKHDIDLAKYLNFYAYDLICSNIIVSETNMFYQLHDFGFDNPFKGYLKSNEVTLETIRSIIKQYKETKDDVYFLTDGLVFSIDARKIQEQMGSTSHHPKGKMAFKLQNEQGVTTVNSITYDVGKNGKVSFVANVEPILLSGAIIKNVTLHNAKYIIDNEINIGSKINIIRSGEVIPKFLSIADNSNVKDYYSLPTLCPSCNSMLNWSSTNTDLVCDNIKCNRQILKSIIHWCKTIEIDGVSEGILSYLYEIKLITNYKDIYKLTEVDIRYLPGFGETSAYNIITAIDNRKNINCDRFVIGLNMSGVGKGTAKDIMTYYKTIDNFIAHCNDIAGLCKIDGIGETTAWTICNNSDYIREEYNALIKLGINIIDNYNIVKNKSLSFCVTGTLSKGRSDIHKDIEQAGYVASSGVTKDLDYLVCNDVSSNSSKVKNAYKHNIKIITEKQLYELLRG